MQAGTLPTSLDPSAVPNILAVGRLSEQKNLLLLLRAAASLRDLPWRLVILGTGPDEQQLKSLAAELGIADRTVFAGYVGDPTPYLQRARVLALPSRWEDLPAVVLEAMACGCPVVATACADSLVAVMTEANYGRLVPPGDEAAFAAALAAMLTDPPERRRPEVVGAYSIANGVADHLQAIRPWLTRA
jgi:glycosyltransferase involved in cell wall biosynthesis